MSFFVNSHVESLFNIYNSFHVARSLYCLHINSGFQNFWPARVYVYMYLYMFICTELIEETGRHPGLIFGM